MSFLGNLFGRDPWWVTVLPPYLKPTQHQIDQIKELQSESGGPDDQELLLFMRDRPESIRKAQREVYRLARKATPGAPEEALLMAVLITRGVADMENGINLFGLADLRHATDDAWADRVRQIVREHGDLESLIDVIMAEEKGQRLEFVPSRSGLVEVFRRIDQILAG